MANPFDGSGGGPPIYKPQTYQDPVTGIVYELDRSGYGWLEVGYQPPAGTGPPKPPPPPPAPSTITTMDAVVFNAARSYAADAMNYNVGLYSRYSDAMKYWQQGNRRDPEPVSPVAYYRISDFGTLLMIMNAGLKGEREGNPPAPVPMPDEITYSR